MKFGSKEDEGESELYMRQRVKEDCKDKVKKRRSTDGYRRDLGS